jgi:hypothetical protein
MDDEAMDNLLLRVQKLELMLSYQPAHTDHRDDIASLKAETKKAREAAEAALVREIPSTAGLVNSQQMMNVLRGFAEGLTDEILNSEKLVTRSLGDRIDGSLGQVVREVGQAKSAAASHSSASAAIIRSICANFGRIA